MTPPQGSGAMVTGSALSQRRADVWSALLNFERTCAAGRPDVYFWRHARQLVSHDIEMCAEFAGVWERARTWCHAAHEAATAANREVAAGTECSLRRDSTVDGEAR